MSRGLKVATVLLTVLVLLICAWLVVARPLGGSGSSGGSTQEVEDCDAGDIAEGDSDCYGIDLKKKSTPKARTTPRQSTGKGTSGGRTTPRPRW